MILKRFLSTGILHSLLIILSLGFILPFVWMLLTSLKPLNQVDSEDWIPQPHALLEAYDIIEAKTFIDDLVNEKTAIHAYLHSQLSDAIKESLLKADENTLPSLINNMNVLIGSKNFSDHPIFTPYASKAKNKVEGDHQPLLNRTLLALSLPESITPPTRFQWHNYIKVFKEIPYLRYYWNSILVAFWVTFLQVFTSSLAAFSFSRLNWPGREKVFMVYLGTMMLPGLVMMIPNYQVMITFGLVDSLKGLIIPAAFTAFGTFLLRQFMLSISTSLDEAAEIDGASKWRLYWDIILPLARPGLITLSIFTFMGNYHSFFWPLVMIKSQHLYTLPIGLLYFDSSSGQQTNLLMAAVAMSVIPMIIIFVCLQKYLVNGIQLGGVKE